MQVGCHLSIFILACSIFKDGKLSLVRVVKGSIHKSEHEVLKIKKLLAKYLGLKLTA